MHEIYYLSLGINAANVIILLLLLSVYWRNYRHMKSGHTTGLMIFSLLFLATNIVSIHLGIFDWPSRDIEVITHIVGINVIQFLGLLSLLWITWK
jgi:hypothetical protein